LNSKNLGKDLQTGIFKAWEEMTLL